MKSIFKSGSQLPKQLFSVYLSVQELRKGGYAGSIMYGTLGLEAELALSPPFGFGNSFAAE